ncbi:MAG TPA: cytochrome P450 [Acidimicrobiales bacterium]|nr:cytochrome P450 [Acidimicrobiales bacterium]
MGWRYVREGGQVYPTADGTWLLTSHEAVRFAHQHPEIFSSARAFDTLGSPVPLIPIAIDPPDHKRYRRILDPMLAPKVINAMEDTLRAQVRDLVTAFAGNGSCEVMDDLARLYPTQAFLTLFGMPLEDRDQFIHWAETIIEHSNNGPGTEMAPEVAENAMALFGYLQDYVNRKRAHPEDDILSRILALEGDDQWSDEEVLGLCFLFTLAGLDTVTAEIGFLLLHLAEDSELRQRIVADPSLVGPVIEEILRLELPAPLTPRVVTQDVEVCGVAIPEGTTVMLCLATANRDPANGDHLDAIDPDRGGRGHLAFGGGVHRCLGSHLARRELRLVVEEFHKLIPDYELAPGPRPEVVWPSGTLHLASLPLVFPVTER